MFIVSALDWKKHKILYVLVNDSDLRKLHEHITNHYVLGYIVQTVIFQLYSSVSKGICIFFSVFGLYVVMGHGSYKGAYHTH